MTILKVKIPPVKNMAINPSDNTPSLIIFYFIVNILYSDVYMNLKVFIQGN